jgi:hypothetical protein
MLTLLASFLMLPERDATQAVVRTAEVPPNWPDIALIGFLAATLFGASALTLLFL